MSSRLKLAGICFAAALGLAACGGGGGGTATVPPTPYESAMAAIAAATTAAAAQAAYDAVKDDVTASQGERLQALVTARQAALATAARAAAQKMALSTAAAAIDTSDLSTQELVDAANTAIRGLRQALEDADDVSDADKAMYQMQLDNAVAAVDTAQGGIDTATRRSNQMAALSSASTTLQSALAALSGATPTQAQLDAANNARDALNAAIAGGADLTDEEKATYVREAANAAAPIQTAQAAFDDAKDKADDAANKAMAATAAKLHAGINAPSGDGSGNDDYFAAYSGDGDSQISVTYGTGDAAGTAVPLSEDKKTTVAAHYGWTGKRYAASPTGGGTYEAHVYSHVGAPTPGKKFNVGYTLATGVTDLTAATQNGEVAVDTSAGLAYDGGTASAPETQARVASPSFDQTAGRKEFELANNNNRRVMIAGSYHGVSGTWYCAPTSGEKCTANVAAKGFTLTGGTWSFKPGNAEALVMSAPDTSYASFGWWLHRAANGDLTASAFVDRKGVDEAASGITALMGTATYMGGAVGKYALSSTTGGTNDAGHFTARATLEANFNDDTISGTIDNFMGVGGAKDWSVELKESTIGDTGPISSDGTADAAGNQTVWTIGGKAANAAGSWSGSLQENDDDGVPGIATGTFYTEYGTAGKMVGAFGVNKQ